MMLCIMVIFIVMVNLFLNPPGMFHDYKMTKNSR